MGYLVKLEVFEGPFDLLLNLIDQAEIDIMDIPIAQITEDYLGYLRRMQELDLVVSGDFLVMAATLLQIKAKMLLPKKPKLDENDTDDEEDPRDQLVMQLLEDKFYKEAAEILKNRAEEITVFPRVYPEPSEQKPPVFANPVGDADARTLANMFAQVLSALEESKKVSYVKRGLSVAECIGNIRLTLLKQESVSFSDLLVHRDRAFIVVTFLAVLELVRMREINAVQKHDFGDIRLIRR